MWTEEEEKILIENYPEKGKKYCMEILNKTEAQIRQKASRLKLKLNKESEFFKEFQKRAALSKIGKKRPEQSLVMKNLHSKGKLIRDDDTNKLIGKKVRQHFKENGHPKGFLNHKHSEVTKSKISLKSKEFFANLSPEAKERITDKILNTRMKNGKWNSKSEKIYSRGKSGKRKDLGKFFRSKLEANYARYLKFCKIEYEYETKVFWFENIKRGTRSYTIDFYIPSEDKYIETKGWLDKKSITKLKRLKKYYPEIFAKTIIVKQSLSENDKIKLIDIGFKLNQIQDFSSIKKYSRLIENWE